MQLLLLLVAAGGAPMARLEPKTRVDRRQAVPPKTPEGLPQCSVTLLPTGELPRAQGEMIRYHVDINGISVGQVDFRIERNGTIGGRQVTEYRSVFELDSLVSQFVPVAGRAQSVVPAAAHTPTVASNHYKLDGSTLEENITLEPDGKSLASRRKKNGREKEDVRAFPGPVQDFVSGFYMLRSLPADMKGCAIVYGNQRAYTIWITPDGTELIKTPVGMQSADRYLVRYASEKSKKPFEARLWMSRGPGVRLPYQAEILGEQKLVARVHMYEAGAN